MTYYTSLAYTNYTLVTDWYVAGNEIADHTYVLLRPSVLWAFEPSSRAAIGSNHAEVPPPHPGIPILCSFGSPNSWLHDILE